MNAARWLRRPGAWTTSLAALMLLAASTALRADLPADPGTEPLPIDWENLDRSVLDLSGYLRAPAGRDGFVKVEGGHLVEPDGRRFRIWGVNLVANHCFPEHADAERLAADLARLGINCVRFHGLDAPWGGHNVFDPKADTTRRLNPETLEKLDYLIAQFKKRGIYSNLNLNVFRNYRPGDGVRDAKQLGLGKSATYFNPRLIELQKEYATQLLTHRNAYTGQEYRHEPAIAFVELVNENSVVEAWVGGRLIGSDDPKADGTWRPIPVSYAEELTDQYNAWLAKNVAADVLATIRKEAGVGADGRVPRLRPDQFAKASVERFRNEARFYLSLEESYFAGMDELLKKELGAGAIVAGTADHNDGYAAFGHIRANARFPLIDGHGYWEHPRTGEVPWIKNTPMVNDPLDSTVVQFARTPVVGKPFTISEINHPFPHEYACEGFPILTAYALFHDWDGIYWFTWQGGRLTPAAEGIRRNGYFDVSVDPVKVATIAACGLLWHRQDVAAARQTVVRSYTEEQILDGHRMDRKERPYFLPGFARSTALEHATRLALDGTSATAFPPPAGLGRIGSDTGELVWKGADSKQGLVTVATPRSEAVLGHVEGAAPLPHLGVGLSNRFAAVLLTAADGKPIAESSRLLLLTGSRVADTGQAWKDDRQTVARWGTGPVRVEPVRGVVRLRDLNGARAVTARALSPTGAPSGSTVALSQGPEGWVLPLEGPPVLWWEIGVER